MDAAKKQSQTKPNAILWPEIRNGLNGGRISELRRIDLQPQFLERKKKCKKNVNLGDFFLTEV